MTSLRIHHRTTYRYRQPVAFGSHRLMLRPREKPGPPEAMAELLKLIPYGRIGEPPNIASAVLFLASDLSDYMTGTSLFVDGGMSLYPSFRGAG